MGGKNKTAPAQRTKGNAKPSSSARAAELLEQSGAGSLAGFIGFGSFAEGLGQVSRLAGASTDVDSGFGTETASELDKDFALALKKLSKKDAITKLKGMQEFTQLLSSKDLAIVISVLPYWPKIFQKMSTDVDRRVREATCIALNELVKLARRNIAPQIKSLMGPWLIAQCDPHAPAASAAQEALNAAFSQEKRADAIGFCRVEILAHIADYLFEQMPETLSDPKTTDPEEMISKYNRLLSQSLEALSLFITSLPRCQQSSCIDSYRKILSNAKFWKFSKHQMGQVRAAFFTCVSAFCQASRPSSDEVESTDEGALSKLIEEHRQQIGTAVLYNVDESEPIVLRPLWKSVLQVVSSIPSWWEVANLRKAVLPRLWTTLKAGGHGCATAIYPSVLPLVSKMPIEYRQISSDDGSTAAWFWEQLLDNIATGLSLDRVQMSRIECNALVDSLMECIRFCIFSVTTSCKTDSSSSAATHSANILEKIRNLIVNLFKSSLVDKSPAIANSRFYPALHSLLVSIVQNPHCAEHGRQIIDDITQIFFVQISDCERRARGSENKNHLDFNGRETFVELERIGAFIEVCSVGASSEQVRGAKRVARGVSFVGQEVPSENSESTEKSLKVGTKSQELNKDEDSVVDCGNGVTEVVTEKKSKSQAASGKGDADTAGFLLSDPEGSLRKATVKLCWRAWSCRNVGDVSGVDSFLRLFTRLISSSLSVSTKKFSLLEEVSAAIMKENPGRELPLSGNCSICFQFLVHILSDLLAPTDTPPGSLSSAKSQNLSERSYNALMTTLRKVFSHVELEKEKLELVKRLTVEPWCLTELSGGLLVEFVEEWQMEGRCGEVLVDWLGGEEFGRYVVGMLELWIGVGGGEEVEFRWGILKLAYSLDDTKKDTFIGGKYVNKIINLIESLLLSGSSIRQASKPSASLLSGQSNENKACDLLLFLFSLSADLSFFRHPSIAAILLLLFEEELAQNQPKELLEKIGATWRTGYRAIRKQEKICRGFLFDAMARLQKITMLASTEDLEAEYNRLAQLASDLVEDECIQFKVDDCKLIIEHFNKALDCSTLSSWQPIALFCVGMLSDVVPCYSSASYSELIQAMKLQCFLARFLVNDGFICKTADSNISEMATTGEVLNHDEEDDNLETGGEPWTPSNEDVSIAAGVVGEQQQQTKLKDPANVVTDDSNSRVDNDDVPTGSIEEVSITDDILDEQQQHVPKDDILKNEEDQGSPVLREILKVSTILDIAALLSICDCITRLQNVDSPVPQEHHKIFTTLASLLERDFTTLLHSYSARHLISCAFDRSLKEGGLLSTAFGALLRRLPENSAENLIDLLKEKRLQENGGLEGGEAGVQTLQVALRAVNGMEEMHEISGGLLETQLALLMTCPADRLTSIEDGGIKYLSIATSALSIISSSTINPAILDGYMKLFSDWRSSHEQILLFNTTLDDNPYPTLTDWLTVSLNSQMALFLTRCLRVGYPSGNTDHWDTILCSLVSWLETLRQSRRDNPLTSADPLTFTLAASVFELATEVIRSIEVQLPIAPETYPTTLAEEWSELFCGSVYEVALPMFVRTAEDASELNGGPEMRELLLRISSVVNQCRKSHLQEIRLHPAKQGEEELTVLQAALSCLSKLLPSHIRCVQITSYRLLEKIIEEVAKRDEALSNESEDKKLEGTDSALSPPTPLIVALDLCLSPLTRSFGEPITLPIGSPDRHLARDYLLNWALLLKLFKHSPNEIRPRYASFLSERGSVDQLIRVLFQLMPGKSVRSSSNSGIAEVVASKYKFCFTDFPPLEVAIPDWSASSMTAGNTTFSKSTLCKGGLTSKAFEKSFSKGIALEKKAVKSGSSLSSTEAKPLAELKSSQATAKSSMISSSAKSSSQASNKSSTIPSSTVDEIKWLACSVYLMTLETLPAVVRQWWTGQSKQVSGVVEKFTAVNVSPLICARELAAVSASTGGQSGGGMTVKARTATNEVVATYTKEECSMELVISLPSNMPLGVVNVDSTARLGIDQKRWRNWMLQLMTFLTYQNGSIVDGLALWKRNVDNCFEGLDDCMICFSVVHGSNYQLPRLQCKTCHKRFHAVCLYRWFSTSQNSACPLCRNLF